MSLFSFPLVKTKTPRQVISHSWDERTTILESDVNLFCWKRPVDIAVSSYLGQLLEQQLQPIVFYTDVQQVATNVHKVRAEWDYLSLKAADLFWKDVSSLITDFLNLNDSKSGTVHLKVVDGNGCTKFHTDGYSLRLFTTYYGLGTEWLPEKATNRKGLGKSNELIVADSALVQRMDSFEVGILKGEIPNRMQSVKGIVHRSPEISHTGEKRIILRVDI